jgi:hypothetical protein
MSRTSLFAVAAAVLACVAGKASAAVTSITSIYFTGDQPMVWPDSITNSTHHTLESWAITEGAGVLKLTNQDTGTGADGHTYTFGVDGDPFVTTIIELTNESTVDWLGYDVQISAPVGATVSFVPTWTPYSTNAWNSITLDQANTVIHFSGTPALAPNATTEMGYKIWIAAPTGTSVSYTVTGTPILAPEPASLLLLAPVALGLLARRRR